MSREEIKEKLPRGAIVTQQKQLFGCNKPIVNVIKLDPTDILDAEDLFFIQKLMKLGIKTEEIINKFEYQDRQFVLDYIERLKREAKEGKWNCGPRKL